MTALEEPFLQGKDRKLFLKEIKGEINTTMEQNLHWRGYDVETSSVIFYDLICEVYP